MTTEAREETHRPHIEKRHPVAFPFAVISLLAGFVPFIANVHPYASLAFVVAGVFGVWAIFEMILRAERRRKAEAIALILFLLFVLSLALMIPVLLLRSP